MNASSHACARRTSGMVERSARPIDQSPSLDPVEGEGGSVCLLGAIV
jgi:hypothetical protein